MRRRTPALVLLGALTIGSIGCGGSGGDPAGVTQTPSGNAELDDLQALIFTPRCATSGCHVGGSAAFGLDLSDGLTYGNTVGIESAELMGFDRIVRFDAANSYLYMKVSSDPRIMGDPMPFDPPLLSSQELLLIETWTNDGADP